MSAKGKRQRGGQKPYDPVYETRTFWFWFDLALELVTWPMRWVLHALWRLWT